MKGRSLVVLALAGVLCLLGSLPWARSLPRGVGAAVPGVHAPGIGATRAAAPGVGLSGPAAESQPNAFFEPQQFYGGLQAARNRPEVPAPPGQLIGALVPHHILAGELLSTVFAQIEAAAPQTIIVVGPNHPDVSQPVITGRHGWATNFGVVQSDPAVIDLLVSQGGAVVDDATLSTEHSVGAIMPYIKYHAPAARVVPLILHREVTPAEADRLAALLAPLLGKGCILIASVDFSHYLTRAEAEAKDVETWQAIEAEDLPALWRFGPEHLDSPPSLGLLLRAMARRGATGPQVLGHTNSGVLLHSDQIQTTSYFALTFRLPGSVPASEMGSTLAGTAENAPAEPPAQ